MIDVETGRRPVWAPVEAVEPADRFGYVRVTARGKTWGLRPDYLVPVQLDEQEKQAKLDEALAYQATLGRAKKTS